jgi:hypothetical protein
MQIAWWGIDAGSGDHPMNTTIRYMRPDLARRFEEKMGSLPFPRGASTPRTSVATLRRSSTPAASSARFHGSSRGVRPARAVSSPSWTSGRSRWKKSITRWGGSHEHLERLSAVHDLFFVTAPRYPSRRGRASSRGSRSYPLRRTALPAKWSGPAAVSDNSILSAKLRPNR